MFDRRSSLLLFLLALAGCTSTGPVDPGPEPEAGAGSVRIASADFHSLTLAATFTVTGAADPDAIDDAEIVARHGGRVLAVTQVVEAVAVADGIALRGDLLVPNEAVAAGAPRADRETVTVRVHVNATAGDRPLFAETRVDVPVLRPPVIELAEVRLRDHGPLEATLAIDLRIVNPNPWPLDFQRLRVTPRVDGTQLDEVLFDLIGQLVFDDGAARLTVLSTTRFTGDNAPLYNLFGRSGAHDVAVSGRAVFEVDGPISPLEARVDDAGRYSW